MKPPSGILDRSVEAERQLLISTVTETVSAYVSEAPVELFDKHDMQNEGASQLL